MIPASSLSSITPTGATPGEPIEPSIKSPLKSINERITSATRTVWKYLPQAFAHLALTASVITWSLALRQSSAPLALSAYGLLATASAIYILMFKQKADLKQSKADIARLSLECQQLNLVLSQDTSSNIQTKAQNYKTKLSEFLTKWKDHPVARQFSNDLSAAFDKISSSLQSIGIFRHAPIDMSQSIDVSHSLLSGYMESVTREILPKMLTQISEYEGKVREKL